MSNFEQLNYRMIKASALTGEEIKALTNVGTFSEHAAQQIPLVGDSLDAAYATAISASDLGEVHNLGSQIRQVQQSLGEASTRHALLKTSVGSICAAGAQQYDRIREAGSSARSADNDASMAVRKVRDAVGLADDAVEQYTRVFEGSKDQTVCVESRLHAASLREFASGIVADNEKKLRMLS